MATYVCSDIHGQFAAWLTGIEMAGINLANGDEFIVLGDLIDRGPESLECVSFVLELSKRYPNQVTYLMGNHEKIMLDFLNVCPDTVDGYNELMFYGSQWISNGGLATARSFIKNADFDITNLYSVHKIMNEQHKDIIEKLNELAYYKVDEKHNCVYVHAGFEGNVALADQDEEVMVWIRDDFFYRFKAVPGDVLDSKLVVHGHTPIQYFGDYTGQGFYTNKHHLALDGGAAMKEKILIVQMDDYSYIESYIDKSK